MKILIYDITFEYDYDEYEMEMSEDQYEVYFNDIESSFVVDDSELGDWEDESELEELLSDFLSDFTGLLHQGFSWKYLEQ